MDNLAGMYFSIEELGGFAAVADLFNVKKFNKRSYRAQSRKKEHTVNEMLFWSEHKIRSPLLMFSFWDRFADPTKTFEWILEYMGLGEDDFSTIKKVGLAQRLINERLRLPQYTDEIYLQLIKQTRRNPDPESTLKAWELLHLVSSTMPPSKDFVRLITEYIRVACNSEGEEQVVREIATKSRVSLERVLKFGPRRYSLSVAEIECFLTGQSLTCIVFFLDETFEELTYELTTTVSEAMKQLADIIKLQNYQTFTLFECRKMTGARRTEDTCDEHIMLDDNKYIADVLFDFKKSKSSRDGVQSKLLVKKKLFKETDESITESQFINLSFVQAQYDYLLGNYPVVKEDAAQLCALQALAEHGSVIFSKEDELMHTLQRYIPKHAFGDYAPEGWLQAVIFWSRVHGQSAKEEAQVNFLRILRSLPYGHSIFFPVNKIKDPIGLIPKKLILGINKRGIHFFAPSPREYFHSAELRDITQFGSSNNAVFFKMRVIGVLHSFQFKTREGEHICFLLKACSDDIMMTRCSQFNVAATQSISSNCNASAPLQTTFLETSRINTVKKSSKDGKAAYDLQLEGNKAGIEVLNKRILEMDSLFESRRKEVECVLSEFVEHAELCEAMEELPRGRRFNREEIFGERSLSFSRNLDCINDAISEDLVEKVKQVMDICGPLKFERIEELKECEHSEFEKKFEEQKQRIYELNHQLLDVRALRKQCSSMLEEQKRKIRTVVCLESLDPADCQSKIMSVARDAICLLQDETDGVDSEFLVDEVFAPKTSSQKIFESVKGTCENTLQGFNVHVVNIGTRSSGKKKTMFGTYVDQGFITKAVGEIFRLLKSSYKRCKVSLEWSMMELREDQMKDLLATGKKKLILKQDLKGLVHVVNLEFHELKSVDSMRYCISDNLTKQRHHGHCSSSSSLFVTVNVRCFDKESGIFRQGRIVFSDLVACNDERSSFNDVSKVVEALCDNASEVPYNACTLTKFMSDCFGGNANTFVMAHVNSQDDVIDDVRKVLDLVKSLRKIRNVASKYEINGYVFDIKKKLDEVKLRKGVPPCLLEAVDMFDVTNEPPAQKLIGNCQMRPHL